MKKRICAGENKNIKAYFDIEIKNENDKPVLSICGDIYKEGEILNCGQCIDEIASLFPTEKNKRIEAIWKRWHLNDFHAGCVHQRSFEHEPYENHKDDVCPICNYKYGTAWIYEELPHEIINEVKTW